MAAKVSLLRAGLGCRCPCCGKGALFDGFLKIRATCDACGLAIGDQDLGDGPAVFLIFIIGSLAVPLGIAVDIGFAVPVWVPAAASGVFAIVATVLLLRPAKALVLALQYRYRR